MRIVIQYFETDEDDVLPTWKEKTLSIEGAEEALGRLERYLQRQKEKERNITGGF